MAYPKGAPKPEGSGRQKGTPNKITKSMRDAVYQAFENKGGVAYLEKLAEDDPKTFAMLCARLIPAELKAEVDNTSSDGSMTQTPKIKIEWVDPKDADTEET